VRWALTVMCSPGFQPWEHLVVISKVVVCENFRVDGREAIKKNNVVVGRNVEKSMYVEMLGIGRGRVSGLEG